MPEILPNANALGKRGTSSESSQAARGNSESPRTLPRDERRAQAADAFRRATWRATKMVAAALGLQTSTLYDWTSGERRSPVESVDIATERALREGEVSREDAVAMIAWLAERHLSPTELEAIAPTKRVDEEGRPAVLRLARQGIESATDHLLAGGLTGEQALAIRRELRRASGAIAEAHAVMDEGIHRFGGDVAAEKGEARSSTLRASERS